MIEQLTQGAEVSDPDRLRITAGCACLLHADGSLAKPCWAHYLLMLRRVFRRDDI